MQWIKQLDSVTLEDAALVGQKSANLGELINSVSDQGVSIPEGFVITTAAYQEFIRYNGLRKRLNYLLNKIDPDDIVSLTNYSERIKALFLKSEFPNDMTHEIGVSYQALGQKYSQREIGVAIRSSGVTEDLPTASFAGQQETFLNVEGLPNVLDAIKACFASLFTPQAIRYRYDMGFDLHSFSTAVCVQRMIHAGLGASGVIFTLDTETGDQDTIYITATYGLGENIAQGRVIPDEFYLSKSRLRTTQSPLTAKRLGTKMWRLEDYDLGARMVKNYPVADAHRAVFSLSEEELTKLGQWSLAIEETYSAKHGSPTPMDIEWAKDGKSKALFILQARPETVHSQHAIDTIYQLRETGAVLLEGRSVGHKISSGAVRVLEDVRDIEQFQPGEILVTDTATSDWEPILHETAGIITNSGGRTCHLAILVREFDVPTIVGTETATEQLQTGQTITLSCAEGEVGKIYEGTVAFDSRPTDAAVET